MEPTGAAPLRPTDLREVGPYRLLGRLGEGGMGTVFLARAPTGRFVALKVVKAEFANQEGFAARFHAEVDSARRVASFCTAQVLDNGNTGDGRPYMVTEYIAGTPLSDQISKHGSLDPGPLHGVALGVAAALAAIHVAELVHRDLKPANVILSLSGPRVIDFGIARALDRESGFTLSGELLGSPGWWAPEQVRGEPVSPAADIFAWGCLVAYAGNGRHPFGRGDPITLAHRVLNTQPDLGTLPAPLDDLVRLATSMDPAQRPTAQDLLIALVGGNTPTPSINPPTLVATEMLNDWRPPQEDDPDVTATFTTPRPDDATRREPVIGSPGSPPGPGRPKPPGDPSHEGSSVPQPGAGDPRESSSGQTQASVEERARREEQAARNELARWDVRHDQDGAPQPVQRGTKPTGRWPEPPGATSTDTRPGERSTPTDRADDEPATLGGSRTSGTRWLIAAAAAVLAIVVTAGVLIVTSGRTGTTPGDVGAASPGATGARPNDVGRRFALGADFDDPVAVVASAPECGLKTYEGSTASRGQFCVIRWTMINPGGERKPLAQPVVSMVDDRGAEHDPAAVTLPPAILPGGRVDSAFVFDLPNYRKPVKMTATMLENGKQIEVTL
ncbi:serine/threonine protein kinase [Nonomuraea deserti]|uniref:Serine/threonine protein kinase n=1 Tax=Nonomuraea deserti TaxID=1848322 RepID=A0A4R4UZA2_9ACTN|nr:serine/threonine-protein kinase [Nonomuraea deserti]TDC94203.1 serine/threonine protein kinase [Nonomuraea deserti]